MNNHLEFIKDFICKHQGYIIEFEYAIASLHKELRINFDEKERKRASIEERLLSLYKKSNEKLLNILNTSYSQIRVIYGKEIRFSIKIIEKDRFENIFITDYYREDKINIDKELKRARDHTPFANILFDNNNEFMSNDLEADFLKSKYRDPRLRGEKIKDLKEKKISWEECWIKCSEDVKLKFYNSLLVMPLTLKNNSFMQDEFSTDFNTDKIWGFFCLDSENKNAFENKELMHIARIMTDILSIYFIFLYEHTEGSQTFNNALDYLIDILKKRE